MRHGFLTLIAVLLFAPAAGAQLWPDSSGTYRDLGYWAQVSGRTGENPQQPLLFWSSDGQPRWFAGLDVYNSANGDFVIGSIIQPDAQYPNGAMADTLYIKTYPAGNAIGLNMTPPLDSSVSIGNHSSFAQPSTRPTLWLVNGQGQQREAVVVSNGSSDKITGRWWPNGALETTSVTAPIIDAGQKVTTPRVNANAISAHTLIDRSPRRGRQTCTRGEITWGVRYLFVCVATDRWKRARLRDVP